MKKIISLMIVFCMVFNVSWAIAEEDLQDKLVIHVAVTGSDMNPGTEEKPLATLTGARNKIREIKKRNKPIDVIFHKGEYLIKDTVFFDKSDSGNKKAPITYKSAGDGEVLFSAGIEIDVSKFEPVTEQAVLSRLPKSSVGRVGQIDLTSTGASIADFAAYGHNRGFYLNERKQKVAKWPNSNFAYIEDVVGSSVFKYKNENASKWSAADDMYIEGYLASEWTGGAYRCEVDPSERTIKVIGSNVSGGHRWRAINLIEEMDIPGEFYVDTEKKILYYYPEKKLDVQKDRLIFNRWAFNMVNVKDCDYMSFEGLSFAYTDGTCIDMANCSYINVKECTFKCANTGVVADFAENFTADSNVCYEMSGSGIMIYQDGRNSSVDVKEVFGEPNNSNIVIKNNHLSNCFLDHIGSGGLVGFGGTGVIVEHNTVSGSNTQAVIGGGPDCVIRYNDIYNAVRETADAGAYYCGCSWTLFGNTVEYNFIHDLGDSAFEAGNLVDCVFWDDTVSGQTARYNILYPNSKQRTYGVISGGGSDNTIDSNTIIGADIGIGVQDRTSGNQTTQQVASGRTYNPLKPQVEENSWMVKKYPQMKRIYSSKHFRPDYNTVTDNVLIDTQQPNIAEYIRNSPTTTYAGNYNGDDYSIFVNPDKYDFRIKKSAKEELGLGENVIDEDFDLSLIGTQTDMPNVERSFYKTYPKNGDKGFDPENVTLSWQKSFFADEYFYEVATDLEFNNIVQSGKTIYNNVLLKPLEKNTNYYWRVTAKNISLKFQSEVEASGAPYLFTTSEHIETIDYSLLKARIVKAKKILESIDEGDKLGEYKYGTKDELRSAIDVAEFVVKDNKATQIEIYNADEVLSEAIKKAQYAVHVGFMGTIDTDASKWESLSGVDIKSSGDEITFTRVKGNGLATTKSNVPGYGIYSFMLKENASDGWFAVALHHNVNTSANIYDGGGLSTCYFLVKPNQIELQTINQTGKRRLMIVEQNDGFYDYNDWIKVEFGVLPMRMGMLVYLKMNDRQVYEYLDEVNPTLEDGMMCISPASSITLKSIPDAPNGVEYIPGDDVFNTDENLHYYTIKDKECSVSGTWENDNSVEGFDKNPVITTSEKNANVLFDVTPSNEIGYYKVSIYKMNEPDMDKNVTLEMSNLYTSYKTKLDISQEKEGWVDLGTFNFVDESAKGHMKIRLTASGEGKLPMSAVKVEKATDDEIKFFKLFQDKFTNGIVLKIGNKNAYVNGLKYVLDSEATIRGDRTLVPLRFISEAYKGEVVWNEDNKTADVHIGDKEMKFSMNESTYTVNGEIKTLETPPAVINGRFMIPIRVVTEEIGKKVDWNQDNQVIVIGDSIKYTEDEKQEIFELINATYKNE